MILVPQTPQPIMPFCTWSTGVRAAVLLRRPGQAPPIQESSPSQHDQPGRPDLLLSFRILLGGINRELESYAPAACLDFGGPNHCCT